MRPWWCFWPNALGAQSRREPQRRPEKPAQSKSGSRDSTAPKRAAGYCATAGASQRARNPSTLLKRAQ
jgi:hypothetical protein